MNDYARRIVMDRVRGSYDDDRDYRDYRGARDYADERDYNDYRRGVKGTGRYSRDYMDSRDYMGSRDYHELRLTKQELMRWKRNLINADGSKGEHYEMMQIMPLAEKAGVRFEEYSEKDFCMTVNMLYSDFCEVVRKFIPPDKELMFFVHLAKAWLEDEDAPPGAEKLALYMKCIVEHE